MEDKDKKEGIEGCNCMICRACGMVHRKMCCGWGSHHHSFLRIIFLLVIIAIVFSLGVKLGELKSEFRGSSMKRGHMLYPMVYPGANYWYGQSSTTPR